MAAFALLLIVATLNRETALFLVFVQAGYAVCYRRRDIRWSVGLLLLWGLTYAGVRWYQGPADNPFTLVYVWQTNWQPDRIRQGLVVLLTVFLPLLLIRRVPRPLWPLAVTTALWTGAIVVFGHWRETGRMALAYLPVLWIFAAAAHWGSAQIRI